MIKEIFRKGNNKILYSFADGHSIDLSNVDDDVFSQKMMGDGIAIRPSNSKIYSPCDGVIVTIMKDSKHAIGIRTEEGIELLIHVGIDTVNLKGEGFNLYCEEGKRVKKGDLLLTFNKEIILSRGLDYITMLIILDSKNREISKLYVEEDVKAVNSPIVVFK